MQNTVLGLVRTYLLTYAILPQTNVIRVDNGLIIRIRGRALVRVRKAGLGLILRDAW